MQPRWIDGRQAIELVSGKTEKPFGVDPAFWFEDFMAPRAIALGAFPIDAFAPNSEGDRYDGTVDLARATRYAELLKNGSRPPPVVALLSRDGSMLRINDGGHRITAARLAGARELFALALFKPEQIPIAVAGSAMGWRVYGPLIMTAARGQGRAPTR